MFHSNFRPFYNVFFNGMRYQSRTGRRRGRVAISIIVGATGLGATGPSAVRQLHVGATKKSVNYRSEPIKHACTQWHLPIGLDQ
jgi:hypothetical protein